MKLHPRYFKVRDASLRLQDEFWKWLEREDLTHLEAMGILNEIHGRVLALALRSERHPNDPEKKADEE